MFNLYFAEDWRDYPDCLPCPQVDTDIEPRERRYISDIGQVKKMRRFQNIYQATRRNIAFVFTQEQAQLFQQWYKHAIIEGGLWFRANWPLLHKEQGIPYRFVTRPVWEFLANKHYHVSAEVEIYEARKVSKVGKIVTSKIYPYHLADKIAYRGMRVKAEPSFIGIEKAQYGSMNIAGGAYESFIYSSYALRDGAQYGGMNITAGTSTSFIYSSYALRDGAEYGSMNIIAGALPERVISYDHFSKADNSVFYGSMNITAGAIS